MEKEFMHSGIIKIQLTIIKIRQIALCILQLLPNNVYFDYHM